MPLFLRLITCSILLSSVTLTAFSQAGYEEAVVDVGNVGLTITNAGFVGRAGIRSNPTGAPSFEYPLDSGVEHLFEAGLWIGAVRSDGTVTVRTGAATNSGGYRPGGTDYEFAQFSTILSQSTLPTSDVFARSAVSHLDYSTSFEDTSAVLPGTSISMPDPSGRLGAFVEMDIRAWNFPFTEAFVIVNFDIVNISDAAWDSVYVGMYHDIVTRNVNTTTDAGGNFFNKGGYGFVEDLNLSYGFNSGGTEETLNTYGAIGILGAEWMDPATGRKRFFHPSLAEEYILDGYAAPAVNPRWWLFSGGIDELDRPITDALKFRRMATPYPNPEQFASEPEYDTARDAWFQRLKTDGQISAGNWIGLTPIGPFDTVLPGDTLQVTFALIAAQKPEEYQGQAGKIVDTPESRLFLRTNAEWARRTYSGEDNNFNGKLDPGEDVNGNGVLDRYLIPEPPEAPRVRVEFERSGVENTPVVALYWDRTSESSVDPVTGIMDFEGYRIYRSNPGDDRSGNILDSASLIAQYDQPGNRAGYNNGFQDVLMSEPVTFEGDPTEYWYRMEARNLKNGWQYLFTITAFDTGDLDAGLDSFESSRIANATRVFPGTPAADPGEHLAVGVYPNPYRVNAAWDGGSNRTRRLNFFNLPPNSEIRIYTLAGEVVKTMHHDAPSYTGDIRWYDNFSAENRILPGGEHSWDILSENELSLSGGLYLFTVKDLNSGDVQRGKFVIIR